MVASPESKDNAFKPPPGWLPVIARGGVNHLPPMSVTLNPRGRTLAIREAVYSALGCPSTIAFFTNGTRDTFGIARVPTDHPGHVTISANDRGAKTTTCVGLIRALGITERRVFAFDHDDNGLLVFKAEADGAS